MLIAMRGSLVHGRYRGSNAKCEEKSYRAHVDTLFVVILVVFLLAAAWIFVSSRLNVGVRKPRLKKTGGTGSASGRSSSAKWRAVRIRRGLISCKAAEKMAGQTYLSMEAPTLPLDECTENKCNCKYIFLEDRRDGKDRRYTPKYLTLLPPLNETDRRHSKGRRITDIQS